MNRYTTFPTRTPLHVWTIALLILLCTACNGPQPEDLTAPGVSLELARYRKTRYQNIRYDLHFNLPGNRADKVTGKARITFTLDKPDALIADFRGDTSQIHSVVLNGQQTPYSLTDEHIVIPRSALRKGENTLDVSFTADDQSLNRRDDFLYTLLVPDRARTLFPCFDQPDLKARFTLSLELPAEWKAIANGATARTDTLNTASGPTAGTETSGSGPARTAARAGSQMAAGAETTGARKRISFHETEPIPTYLFSFVGGRFERVTENRNGRSISLYHRETDPQKTAQCPEILGQVFHALDWLETYTGVPYPFAKYDLIVIPGFQYGGMEHMGATLYADRSMFLENNATTENRMARGSLIAHETAHMWFGDYVTMQWFDDVWTKEVFANFFAAMIVREQFPQIDHRLNFIRSNVPGAYGEDRTAGSTAIRQQLPNLSDAGLLYSQIIYSKSPVVMEMLFTKLGPEKFRDGIREYLADHRYGNATWDDLIAVLDSRCDEDLAAWSRVWVDEKGMPTIDMTRHENRLRIMQSDPFGRRLAWNQPLQLLAFGDGNATDTLQCLLDGPETELVLPAGTRCVLPNADGRSYGYFRLDSVTSEYLMKRLTGLPDDVARLSALITLNENLLGGTIAPQRFLRAMIAYLPQERNQQLFTQALTYIRGCFGLYYDETASPELEGALWEIAQNDPDRQRRIMATQAWCGIARSPQAINTLYELWDDERLANRMLLGENDLTNLSYTLALRFPDRAAAIIARQGARITNPDRQKQYAYIAPAVSPSASVRDSVFRSLLDPANRSIEPWACTALSLLNHPVHGARSAAYIRPGLEELQEIQRTGDIFFPRKWTAALLGSQHSEAAATAVDAFIADHPGYPPLLGSKILQQADLLFRLWNRNAQNRPTSDHTSE